MRPVAVSIFARVPRPGRVKSRLIPAIGADAAAALHRRMTRSAVETAVSAAVGKVYLYATPSEKCEFFDALAEEFPLKLCFQVEGDLGARMQSAIEERLHDVAGAIVIGSDCPSLLPTDLESAARHLADGTQVVLGPAEDGGYYLIGLKQPRPELFNDVPWGGGAVLATTRSRLVTLGVGWHELRELCDIDRPEDLQNLDSTWRERKQK